MVDSNRQAKQQGRQGAAAAQQPQPLDVKEPLAPDERRGSNHLELRRGRILQGTRRLSIDPPRLTPVTPSELA